MKCPDCGNRLTEIRMDAANLIHRCFRCGGFWIDSWSVNRLSSHTLSQWRRISVDPVWLSGGSGVCPLDGTVLQRFVGESVPQTIPASRCIRCGKWWFPRDTMFDYKPAAEAKVNYFRLWGKTADVGSLILPVLSLLVMVGGLALGMGMVRMRQQATTIASPEISEMTAVYLGDSEALVSFRSLRAIDTMQYKAVGESEWNEVLLGTPQDGVYVVNLVGLTEGTEYTIRVLEREYQLKTEVAQ